MSFVEREDDYIKLLAERAHTVKELSDKLFIDTILSWGEISTLDERRAFPQDK